ncbi:MULTISPECIES: HD domain-containing protein [Brevibacillus]|uniref:HD domain-containing protein n=1 Tax=Brevibacillus TaxID=55080 RepID=UPI001EDAED5B|nr:MULTISPECIES: HD domain-containing protein [Brevibacillus]MCM3143020.1 GTP pyrophosphokinase [Brevibacillus sp. MER 51]UKK99111.1 HD domain-containing protein [Brevibacillus brevis]
MSTLEKAIVIATNAHTGQLDKGGNPYILHPLRIMMKMPSKESMIVAVLHDVLEDTEVTKEDLFQAGFSNEIVEAVLAVTRDEDETYMEFVKRAKRNPIARLVKLADLEDNCDLSRIPDPKPKDHERLLLYKEAIKELLST